MLPHADAPLFLSRPTGKRETAVPKECTEKDSRLLLRFLLGTLTLGSE